MVYEALRQLLAAFFFVIDFQPVSISLSFQCFAVVSRKRLISDHLDNPVGVCSPQMAVHFVQRSFTNYRDKKLKKKTVYLSV